MGEGDSQSQVVREMQAKIDNLVTSRANGKKAIFIKAYVPVAPPHASSDGATEWEDFSKTSLTAVASAVIPQLSLNHLFQIVGLDRVCPNS
jgi:hypothetical protein